MTNNTHSNSNTNNAHTTVTMSPTATMLWAARLAQHGATGAALDLINHVKALAPTDLWNSADRDFANAYATATAAVYAATSAERLARVSAMRLIGDEQEVASWQERFAAESK